ncbi:MAG: glycosyltransferase [Salinibacterium sp.]|nr:glycosyltransferase [Salinibacterium sp.]
MQPRVIAVLVARNGAKYLPRTLAALAAQTRRPDSVVLVDTGSSDESLAIMTATSPTNVVSAPGSKTFGRAVARALQVAPAQSADTEWVWLLGHDNAPDPSALSAMLAAVEVAPSVAIAGPKLMRWDEPGVIASFGETMTDYGRSVSLVSGELDQAQHDMHSDLLAVAAGGMLVRRSVWTTLGGFDPGLPSTDAALDFAVRARLAGHRVVGVPVARVASAGPAELFGRRSLGAGAQNRVRRSAQLHRRMVYAPAMVVPLHWLALLPLGILRSLVHLIAKRPGFVGGELAAAIGAAFDGSVPAARRTLRRNRRMGWGAIGALRITARDLRELRSGERSAAAATGIPPVERPGFFAGGGAWVVLLAAVLGILAFGRFANASALAGGGLLPLSATVGELWSHVGYAWHDLGAGFTGASDPFSYVLAVLGSLTFWSPSFSMVLLYLIAIPLSALAAWWCAARFSTKAWGPAVAAIAWGVAPPLLASLSGGHPGAVIAHVLLPSLVLTVVTAARSWSMAAVASVLFAAVAASAPMIVPALLVALIGWAAANPRGAVRVIGIPVPAAVLFAPLIFDQFARGTPLALFAEPGLALRLATPAVHELLVGSPAAGLNGWDAFIAALGVPAAAAPVVVIVLLAPLGILALLAPLLPGAARGIPAMVLGLLGFVTAVACLHLQVSLVGSTASAIWPGAALSVYWLGLVGALTLSLEGLGRSARVPALLAAVFLVVLAVPSLAASAEGATAVAASNGRLLPAFASAEAASSPSLGTLEIAAQPDGGIAVTVQRGLGTTLDEQSTLAATDTVVTSDEERLAVLAGNLASRSGFDVASELDSLQIAFILVPHDADASDSTRQRLTDALDGNRVLTPIGDTTSGTLWHYNGLATGSAPGGPGPLGSTVGIVVLVGQGIVFLVAVLLAIPTTRRRRARSARVTGVEGPVE